MPNADSHYFLGMKDKKSGKLIGFIAAIPIILNLRDDIVDTLEVKFLCVDPKLHKLKMTPVLVRELRRRATNNGQKIGVFFTKVNIGKSFSTVTFYTRPLNVRKVIGTGFIRIP